MKDRISVRSLFISDVHLGCRYCQAHELLKFLKAYQPENLYLVGDIIDGWKMKKNMYWDDTYSFIVRRIIGMIKNGTKIYYLTGNHDEFLRMFTPQIFGHVEIVDEVIHKTLDGKKYLIIHGDVFDQLTKNAKWLYYLGDWAYSFAMWLNQKYNYIRRLFGFEYWSLSLMLKQNVKKAVNFINSFEMFIAKHAKEKGCEGVIAGHIHSACHKTIDGLQYFNCGDWVESRTALIEHLDGTFELYEVGNERN